MNLGRRQFLKMVAVTPVALVALPAISKEVKPEINREATYSPSSSPSTSSSSSSPGKLITEHSYQSSFGNLPDGRPQHWNCRCSMVPFVMLNVDP